MGAQWDVRPQGCVGRLQKLFSSNQPGSILVFDDDNDVRSLLSFALTSAGFETTEASNAEDAFYVLKHSPVLLALLDRNLAGTDGLEILRTMRSDEPTATLPVILVTGQADVADRIEGL